MAFSLEELKNLMKSEVTDKLSLRMDNLDASLGDLKGTVSRVSKSVKTNSAKLDNHSSMIKNNAAEIASMKNEIQQLREAPDQRPVMTGDGPPALRAPVPDATHPRTPTDDREYFMARRSLRLWPIAGQTNQELWANTCCFIRDTLGLTNLTEDMVESISRPDFPSGPMAVSEALVRFARVEFRDNVMGSSARLAGKIDSAGKPTAGIRVEVPKSLTSCFKTLERYGQQLRSRHGPGTRRHVKFDDIDHSLYLNAKLPGDVRWTKISLDVARRGIKTREKLTSADIERRMDIGGTADPERPRAVSTSGATPMETQPSAPVWTGRRNSQQ